MKLGLCLLGQGYQMWLIGLKKRSGKIPENHPEQTKTGLKKPLVPQLKQLLDKIPKCKRATEMVALRNTLGFSEKFSQLIHQFRPADLPVTKVTT